MPVATTVVHKFGGAALADLAGVERIGRLLSARSTEARRVVVTSALQGVTDELHALATAALAGDRSGVSSRIAALSRRHHDIAAGLLPGSAAQRSELARVIDSHFELLEAECRELEPGTEEGAGHGSGARSPAALLDAVLAHGERIAAALLCALLQRTGIESVVVDGAALLITDGRHGDAAPDLDRTDACAALALIAHLARGTTVVVPGFIGAGAEGNVVTLGRGGSDLTATVLARAIDATEVILWKDVAGCMTADPRIVPGARVVPLLDGREASELAYYGAKVLHPRTLVPLRDGMTLRLKPFADPEAKGTTIVSGRAARGAPVRAISGMAEQALVTIAGTGMIGVPGVAARVFDTLAEAHVSVSMISQASSEQSICFTVPENSAAVVRASLRRAFANELARREVDDILVETGLTTIAVVGAGMAHTTGIAARIFQAAADASVNIVAIAQGSSERNVSFVVRSAEAPAAIRAIHTAFRLDKLGGGRMNRSEEMRDVILLGAGRVAQELIGQIGALHQRGDSRLRVVGLIDRSGYVFNARGIPPRQLEALARAKRDGQALEGSADGVKGSAVEAVHLMGSHALLRPVLVDLASGETNQALFAAVGHGMELVMANKVPLAGDLESSRALLREAREAGLRVLHEATVGAGLPVIDTLQQLHASGDRVDSVESSPSGTMGFLFSEMGRGRSFSDAVRDAMARGYTEPDPRDDLCGLDVARKGLILGRMLGYTGEMIDVNLESLVPDSLREVSSAEFLAALPSCDEAWRTRIAEAGARGEVLRYRARATRGAVKVGLVSVPLGSALASLDGTDNLFVFTTARYRDRALRVSGPGAGAAVTAAGVLGDILRMSAA